MKPLLRINLWSNRKFFDLNLTVLTSLLHRRLNLFFQ